MTFYVTFWPLQFMAVYDYNPETQSPNPERVKQEVAFRTGDVIVVYGDQRQDGYYFGKVWIFVNCLNHFFFLKSKIFFVNINCVFLIKHKKMRRVSICSLFYVE